MILNENNFSLNSDLEIRTIREDENDKDIIISLNRRTVNLYFRDLPKYIKSRIQLLDVQNIIIRYSKDKFNNMCTIHILRNIDLHSSIMNFEIDYTNINLEINEKEYYVDFKMR